MNFSGNMRRNNNKMPARGGPLMTDHLHDLDLELELLKRKRQLIQQQQNEMLYSRAPAADNTRYNQPSQSYNDRFNEPQRFDFSHLYNEAPRDDHSFGLKRRAQADWSSGPADHFDSPMGGKRSRQGPFDRYPDHNNTQTFQRPRQQPNKPQPLMGLPKPLLGFQPQGGQRAPQPRAVVKQNQGPKPFNQGPKPFNLGPKPFNQGPKPLTQHPNFKRNKQAGPQPGPNRPFNANKTNAPGFKPNKSITPKKSPVKALNSSLKKNAPILRTDQEPSNKTNGRLELALGMIVKEIKLTYGNHPEYGTMFSSMQLSRVMKQGIRERVRAVMTGKVVGAVPEILAEYRKKHPLDTDKEIVELAAVEQRNNEHTTQLVTKLFEEGDPEEYFKKHMRKILENRWTEILHKLENVIIEENKNLSTADILINLPEIKDTTEKAENISDENPTASDEAPEKPDDKPTDVAATEVAEKTSEPMNTTAEAPTVTNLKEKDYDKWLSLLLERKLPKLLTTHKEAIIRLFDLDDMFRNTKAAIIINVNRKAHTLNTSKHSDSSDVKEESERPRGSLNFVKVLACPSMPRRKIMQEFLNQFKPKTIKRHKKNYNLLFVGLDSKENYDKMLAANGTVIGNATISIMASGKVTTAETGDQNNSDGDIGDVLTPQLDDQIDDLLSSIRKADEESKANIETVDNIDLTEDQGEKAEVTESNGNDNEVIEQTEATTEKVENGNGEAKDDDDCQVIDANGKDVVTIEDDEVAPLKSDEAALKSDEATLKSDEAQPATKVPVTPAKVKAPATPSSIRTRRSSRLVPN